MIFVRILDMAKQVFLKGQKRRGCWFGVASDGGSNVKSQTLELKET